MTEGSKDTPQQQFQQNADGTFDFRPVMVCGAHGPLLNRVDTGFANVLKRVDERFDSLEKEMTRRLDESREDRMDLREKHEALSREVTSATTRLNGAKLIMVQPHHRTNDPEGANFPRETSGLAAFSAFAVKPAYLLAGAVVLAIGFGVGLILLVQTKLDLDTIKAVQGLRNTATSTSTPPGPGR